jgi:hypothetical protein
MMSTSSRISIIMTLLGVLACACGSLAQEPPTPTPSEIQVPVPNAPSRRVTAPCIQPEPMVRMQDYTGPLKKTVGFFTGPLERKSVHPPDYKPGTVLCSLKVKDKFWLFVRDSFDPGTFLVAGFNAGISQAQNQDPSFGQGMAGYGKRFGASFADEASFRFFKDFAYPSIFREDPRYYRVLHASGGKRFLEAIGHTVVAHHDNNKHMFNYSEWLGTISAVSLSNMYHPGNQHGFASSARAVGYSVLSDMGFDLLREFWPEISHTFNLPFRQEPAIEIDTNPAIK